MIRAADGCWKNAPKGQVGKATSKADIIDSIQRQAKNLRPGDTFTIFITDHGYEPKNPTSPLTGGIVLYGKDSSGDYATMSHAELQRALQDAIPPTVNVRLIGIHCYSGGLHDIAFNLPNVCSAASSTFTEPTASFSDINLYGQPFFRKIKGTRAGAGNDLLHAHYAGVMGDPLNRGRQRISSVAYAERVLFGVREHLTAAPQYSDSVKGDSIADIDALGEDDPLVAMDLLEELEGSKAGFVLGIPRSR